MNIHDIAHASPSGWPTQLSTTNMMRSRSQVRSPWQRTLVCCCGNERSSRRPNNVLNC